MMRRICIMLLFFILLTGCWDKVELDDRALVLGAAIDVPIPEYKSAGGEANVDSTPDMYTLTLETPVTKKSDGKEGEGQDSKQNGKNAMLHIDTGSSFFQIIRKMATHSDRTLFFGHQQVLIIGEELAMQHDLGKTLDFWSRDTEIDRSTKVYISRGIAKDIFNSDPQNSESVSMYITDQSKLTGKTSQFISLDLIKVLSKLAGRGDLLIGSIATSTDNHLKVSGCGVIKDSRLKGWLGENETRAAQFVMGKAKGGEIVAEDPDREGSFITAEILKIKKQIKANIQNGIPSFSININIDCNITEIASSAKSINEKDITKTEKAVSSTVEKQIAATVEKLQKQYESDALGFGEYLEKHHNKDWKQIKPKWAELYPEVPVSVKVITRVHKIGRTY